MDEDAKLILQMWRVQVMVNDELQRRIHILEKNLWEKEHVGERIRIDDSFTDWRPSSRNRRRNDDSDD